MFKYTFLLLLLLPLPLVSAEGEGTTYINCQDYGDVIINLDVINEILIDQTRIIRQQAEKIGRQETRIKVLRRKVRQLQ